MSICHSVSFCAGGICSMKYGLGENLFKKKIWIDGGILHVTDLFDANGLLFDYARFLHIKAFPVTYKKANMVIKAVPIGLTQLMKSHFWFQES